MWAYLEKDGLVRREDETTWGNEQWPAEVCRNGGFVGRFPYWKRVKKLESTGVRSQPQAWRNRENPRVHAVFATLLRSRRLWVSVDRYGVMRPARLRHQRDDAQENAAQILAERQTKKQWLHWDLSPFHFGTSAAGFAPAPLAAEDAARYGSLRVQALLALVDCPEANGGFHCVPRFTGDRFFAWAEQHRESYGAQPEVASRNFIEVPEDDPMRAEVTRVPVKAGSLLVWNSQLPHGCAPALWLLSCGLWRLTVTLCAAQQLPQHGLRLPHGAVPQDDPSERPARVLTRHEAPALRDVRVVPGGLHAVGARRDAVWHQGLAGDRGGGGGRARRVGGRTR